MSGTIVFDTETTGLDHENGDRIIQLSAVKLDETGHERDKFNTLVNPDGRKSVWDSWVVHKIDDATVKNAPSFTEVYHDFKKFCENADTVVAHNLSFDLGFWAAECERAGLEDFLALMPGEDTLEMTRKTWPGKPATLDALAKRVGAKGVDRGERHDALDDARLLAACIPKLRRLYIEAISAASEQGAATLATIPDIPVSEADIARAAAAPMLFCRSGYSLGQSILTPSTIIAALKPAPVIGLCDLNSLAGAYEFSKKASAAKIKPVIGQTFSSSDLEFSLFVTDAAGWPEISKASSHLSLTRQIPETIDVANLAACLSAASPRVQTWLAGQDDPFIESLNPKWLAIPRAAGTDTLTEFIALAPDRGLACVIAPIIVAPHGSDPAAVAALGGIPHPLGTPLLLPSELARLYADIPEAFDNATLLANLCHFALKDEKSRLPRYPGAFDEDQDVADLALIGLHKRLEKIPGANRQEYFARLKYEVEMIQKLGFSGYFLYVADFIREARDRDIPVGPGRGSGAGSIVAWALGITDLDPIHFGLFFERFINPDRVSPPDFDIDFCEKRRCEIIAYVANTYGADRVAQIGAWNTMQPKSAFKNAARLVGVDPRVADRLTKQFVEKAKTLDDAIAGSKKIHAEMATDPAIQRAFNIARVISGAISHSTRHAAGVVIADSPLASQTPLADNPGEDAPGGVPATQFDMKSVDAQGLIKFDFLGLKTLTIIKRARDLLKEHGLDIDPWAQSYDDPTVFDMINNGWTRNIFQLGQAGMGRAILEVLPTDIEDLIALVSLYRPGPMDQIPIYALRKKRLAPVEYPHPALRDVLETTFGIPIYQEQIMAMARTLAGYTLAQADLLRRAMGKKIPAEMAKMKASFVSGCVDNDALEPRMNHQQAEDIFHIIEKFAGYGFNRSHAAAYSVITYATAWLKRHHPEAFIAGCLDQEAGKVANLQKTIAEARKIGCTILPIDINKSRALFSIEKKEKGGFAIRYAFSALASIGSRPAEALESERDANGPFTSLQDFLDRTTGRISKSAIQKLAEAGAFDSIGSQPKEQIRADAIHGASTKPNQLDMLSISVEPLTMSDMINREKDAYGFALRSHPVDAFRHLIGKNNIMPLPDALKARLAIDCSTIAEIFDIKQEGGKVVAVATDNEMMTRIEFAPDIMPPLRKAQKSAVAKLRFATVDEKRRGRPGAPKVIAIEILA